MRSVSSRGPLPCPPYASLAASTPDEALRPTVSRRPLFLVEISHGHGGFHPTDLYVRRFWSAHIGVEAVADLLRIVQAGRRGNAIRRPVTLPILLAVGLIHVEGDVIVVVDRIPCLDPESVSRLPLELRRAHQRWIQESGTAQGSPRGDGQSGNFARHEAGRNPKVRVAR
jgi:hypothetical protein